MAQIDDGGSGGGDGSSGSGDSGGDSGGDGGGLSWVTIFNAAPQPIKAFFSAIMAVGTALNTDALEAFLRDPVGFVAGVIQDLIFETILLPAVGAVVDALEAVVNAILILFLGGDLELGVTEGTAIGIADIPFVLLTPALELFGAAGESVLAFVEDINLAIASTAAQAGVGAFSVVAVLQALELGVALWVGYFLLSVVFARFVPFGGFGIGAISTGFINSIRGVLR